MGALDLSKDRSKGGDPMSLAFAEARSAELRGEAPIGAALVRDGTLIASAGNRTRELNDPTAHAEMLVIREAAAKIGAERLVGCDLYVTLEPCAMCAGAISLARLRRLYYAALGPQGRRRRPRSALLPPADLPPCAGGLRRRPRERGGGDAADVFRRPAVRAVVASGTRNDASREASRGSEPRLPKRPAA